MESTPGTVNHTQNQLKFVDGKPGKIGPCLCRGRVRESETVERKAGWERERERKKERRKKIRERERNKARERYSKTEMERQRKRDRQRETNNVRD